MSLTAVAKDLGFYLFIPYLSFAVQGAYIINGNCKNIMNMSQSDQSELWRSVVNRNLEAYLRVSSKLKLGRIPVRLYVRSPTGDLDYVEVAPVVESWDKIPYIKRPIEIHEDAFTSLKNLKVCFNGFVGSIPPAIGNLSALVALSICHQGRTISQELCPVKNFVSLKTSRSWISVIIAWKDFFLHAFAT
ncbi:autophagy protein 5-like [Ipomoea triloba]|uniref:autophagy protein 5-like n=1 Tax=Ipomoea triloba TaxID=35885 RepID=UPI00125D18CA|nr:autophagy protein 5-like [Ipomoea triloba]